MSGKCLCCSTLRFYFSLFVLAIVSYKITDKWRINNLVSKSLRLKKININSTLFCVHWFTLTCACFLSIEYRLNLMQFVRKIVGEIWLPKFERDFNPPKNFGRDLTTNVHERFNSHGRDLITKICEKFNYKNLEEIWLPRFVRDWLSSWNVTSQCKYWPAKCALWSSTLYWGHSHLHLCWLI